MPEQKKPRTASRGVDTTGSPKRLNDVFSNTGTPDASPNLASNFQKTGFVFLLTVWTRTKWSPNTAAGIDCSTPGLIRLTL